MSSNIKNTINIEKFSIDWKKVNKMSKDSRKRYFKSLFTKILKAPVKNPTPVLLGNKYYVTDEKYKDLLKQIYNSYHDVEIKSTDNIEIDWKKVGKMSLDEKMSYFKSLIKKIESLPVSDPLYLRTNFGFCVINRDKESLYKRCLEEYDLALRQKGEQSEEVISDKKEERTSPSKKKSKVRRVVSLPPLNVKPKGPVICSVVAASMVATYSVNLIASALSFLPLDFRKKEEVDEELKPNTYSMMSYEETLELQRKMEDSISSDNLFFERVDEKLVQQLEELRQETLQRLEEERLAEEKARRVALMDEYFKEYCLYFDLDIEKVTQIAKSKTNDYEESLTTLFEDHLYDDVDDETAVMVFVRQIYRDRLGFKLKELGLTRDDLSGSKNQAQTLSLGSSDDGVESEQEKLEISSEEPVELTEKDIYILEYTDPVDFIIRKGIKPTESDLRLLSHLREDFGLTPGVINVLSYYTLKNNDNHLEPSYINIAINRLTDVRDVEQAFVMARHLYPTVLYDEFGEFTEEPIVYSEFVAPTLNEDGVPVARNGEVFSQFIGRISEMIDLDRNYALALCLHETWRGTSTLCLEQNNYGGMRANGEWFTYPSPEAGMIAFCMNLNAYKKYNLKSWQRFADIYAEGSLNWQKNYQSFYREVIRDSEKYFGVDVDTQIVDKTSEIDLDQKVLTMEKKNDQLS